MSFPLTPFRLAEVKQRIGKYDEARDLYEQFLEDNPEATLDFKQLAQKGIEDAQWAQEVIDNEKDILAQLKSMVFKNEVLTYSGIRKPIIAETICLHSDTKGAVQLAKTIHEFFKNNGVEIVSA